MPASNTKPSSGASAPPPRDDGGSRESTRSSDGSPSEEFWSVAKPYKEPLGKPWFLPSVGLILLFATPWYLPSELAGRLWNGLPLWVWNALFGAAVLGVLTAYGALVLWQDHPRGATSDQEG